MYIYPHPSDKTTIHSSQLLSISDDKGIDRVGNSSTIWDMVGN